MKIAIVGAGLIGRLSAWRLLRAGHGVSLFDRATADDRRSAAFAAAAMLAPLSESADCEPEIATLGERSIGLWPTWLNELEADSGHTIYWGLDGSVVVAHQKDVEDLRFFQRKVGERAAWLSTPRLQALEPELAERFDSAVFLPGEGWMDNHALLDALQQAILTMGGHWREQTSVGTLDSLSVDGEDFDAVLDCRGFGAKAQLRQFRGVRGEVIWVHAPEVSITRPVRVMHPRYQLYISPRSDHRYVVGATEIESESMAPVTVRSTLELLSALYTVHSGFAEANVTASYAQLRPAFTDNLPRAEWRGDVVSINGLYRHGYLLGPIMVSKALAMLEAKFPQPSMGSGEVLTLEAG